MLKRNWPVLAGLFMITFFLAGSGPAFSEETLKGETLDPSKIGPSVTESMDVVLERDKTVKGRRPGSKARKPGEQGAWMVPSRNSTYHAHSGAHYIMNRWGDTRMGIGFPGGAQVHGAWIAAQDKDGLGLPGVKAVGYLAGEKVAETEWLREVGKTPTWLAMEFPEVDRIEILSEPFLLGGAWYALDDLTFTTKDATKRTVLGFDDLPYRKKLTGTGYGGLTWETGTGDFKQDGVDAPRTGKLPAPGPDVEETVNYQLPLTTGRNATPPTLIASYQGVIRGDAGSNSYPPDTDGAIGPNHYVETVNRNFAVYDKTTGAELVNVLLGSFLPGSNGDPRTIYDQHSGRWIVIVSDFSATNTIFLAVSLTDDPTGSWFKTSFQTDPSDWPDYPTLGVDQHGIYTAAYMVGSSGMTIFAIDKMPLIAPNPQLGTVTAFKNLPWEGAIQPAHTYGTPGGEYFISLNSSSSLRLRRVNPPLTAPTLTDLGTVSVPGYSAPPNAPALGSTIPLNTVDDRLMMAVYRDGSLWTAHTISASGRAGCRWYEIDVGSASLVQSGTVADTSLHYFFPSIMVNKTGDAVMGFTGSNASQYAACYYTGRLASDPLGEMASPVQFKAGTGQQNNIDSANRNRWGDYSYTTLDPVDELTFWTIQEYGHATDIWGTYIAVLKAEEPALFFTFEDTVPDNLKPGLSSSFEVAIANGKENYVPGSGTLHYRYDGGTFQTAALTDLGGGRYEGTLPNTRPGDAPEFYFSAQGNNGTTLYLPNDAPASLYAYDVFFVEEYFHDDFETDKGWTVTNVNLTDGAWERGVPAGLGDRGDPPTDQDGSGQCYLTDNVYGNSDVDGGPTRLTSPKIDLSAGDATVSYWRWHYNDDNDDIFSVEVSNDDGATWTTAEQVMDAPAWNYHEFLVSDFATPTASMRFRFNAVDNPNNSVTEAGLDAFRVARIIKDAALWADGYDLAASQGGIIGFSLDGGAGLAGRNYLLLGNVTGTAPGFTLPGGTLVPLNWDLFTTFIVSNLGLPVFTGFQGTLDGVGQAQAVMNTYGPVDPALVGFTLNFAFIIAPPPGWNFASNPVGVLIEP